MSPERSPSWQPRPGDSRSNDPAKLTREHRTQQPFAFPIGIDLIEGENYRQREGYDVIYLKDEDTPRYQYTLAVSSERAARAFRQMMRLMPDRVRAVLEVPNSEDTNREICDVWMSGPVPRELVMRAFAVHHRLFVHDGMVGFGAISLDGVYELFMDEHKLLYFYSPDMEPVDTSLTKLGLRSRDVVRHFSELGHIHVSLSGKDSGEAYWEVAEELKKSLGLEWEESKEYM